MSSLKSILPLLLLATARLAASHGAIIAAVGDAGGSGMALGVDTATPRDGTRRNPFQQDSTRFKGDAADTFGETVGAGTNDLEAGTKAIMAETGTELPQVSQGGEIQMTLHQVNADGGGPYTCMINADGTAAAWEDIKVTQQAPGKNSNNRVCSTYPSKRDGRDTDKRTARRRHGLPAQRRYSGRSNLHGYGGGTGQCLSRPVPERGSCWAVWGCHPGSDGEHDYACGCEAGFCAGCEAVGVELAETWATTG